MNRQIIEIGKNAAFIFTLFKIDCANILVKATVTMTENLEMQCAICNMQQKKKKRKQNRIFLYNVYMH